MYISMESLKAVRLENWLKVDTRSLHSKWSIYSFEIAKSTPILFLFLLRSVHSS